MRRLLINCAILLAAVFLVIMSCKKSDDKVEDRKTMLRTGKWKLVDMAKTYLIFKPGQQGYDTTEHDTLLYCDRDDYMVFGPGFNGTINAGDSLCSHSEPSQYNFTWQTQNNDTTIILYGASKFASIDTSIHYTRTVPGTVHGLMPVFPEPYTATFHVFNQSQMVLRVLNTYTDPIDNKKTDTTFWDYTFMNF